jgi:FkbM family methyltransferase
MVKRVLALNILPGRYMLAAEIARRLQLKTPFVFSQIGPYQVVLDVRDVIQQQVFFGIYDPWESQLVQKLLCPGDIFLDIGANIGYYSMLASLKVGDNGQVIAFEPVPELQKKINETIRGNQITNILVTPYAVGKSHGELSLYLYEGTAEGQSQSNLGSASIVPSSSRPKMLTVPLINLDEFLDAASRGGGFYRQRIRLIKMDIEGAELDALQGATQLLNNTNAPDLIVEINPYLLRRQGLESQALTQLLNEHGYRMYTISRRRLKPLALERPIVNTTNIYCTKLPA